MSDRVLTLGHNFIQYRDPTDLNSTGKMELHTVYDTGSIAE